ncbi:helix-turn-helix transcriptional regulator [Vandammella animalimorsus]|uniref:helix-turn-helix transcriptional regulator n=1 Tax=Vandammella animalimorsus TaxID=2029117 RepID=UPI001EEF5E81|nr:AraC family transcriptional regulator [Vandammella animalimorsus]
MNAPHPDLPLIALSELDAQSRLAGSHYRLRSGMQHQAFALRGRVQTHAMAQGATLHLVDVCDDDHAQQVQLQLKPGLRVAWVVQGQADVSYGGQRLLMRAAQRPGQPPQAHAVALQRPEQFTRRASPAGREATVSLCLTPQWLEELAAEQQRHSPVMQAVHEFSRCHLRQAQWRAPPQVDQLLRGLLQAPCLSPELQALYLQGAFQMLCSHVLQALYELAQPGSEKATATAANAAAPLALAQASQAAQPLRISAARRRQMQQVRELLDSGAADHWSLQAIAQHHHMSVATLQRHFQFVHGQGVFEYQRRRRLRLAWQALQRAELDVAQAAALAGYRHAGNFATAFRREFGASPSQLRR